jgi:hypothetical protein
MNRPGIAEKCMRPEHRTWRAFFAEWARNYRDNRHQFWFSLIVTQIIAMPITLGVLALKSSLAHWVPFPDWLVNPFLLGSLTPTLAAQIIRGKETQILRIAVGLFGPSNLSDALFGDLAERYDTKLRQFGKATADRWYLKQLITSIPPLMIAALSRTVRAVVRSK